MKTSLTQTNARFSGIVGQNYHRLVRALPHYIKMQGVMASMVKHGLSQKAPHVLDLGCGSGLTSLAIHDLVSDAVITGVDNEPNMLKQYEEHTCDLAGVTVVEEDILKFLKRCKMGQYDTIVSGFVLHNLPQEIRQRIIMEVGRILKPGNQFVLGDKIAHDSIRKHNEAFMLQMDGLVRAYNNPEDHEYGIGWIEHYIRDNQPDLKQTESEVRTSFENAGFTEIRMVRRFGMDAVLVGTKQ